MANTNKNDKNTMDSKQTEVNQNEATDDAKEISEELSEVKKEIGDELTSGVDEMKSEFNEMLNEFNTEKDEIFDEMAADEQSMLEGTVAGSPEYVKDEMITNVASISAGLIIAIVGAVLLLKARKIAGKSKKKLVGWILVGFGAATVLLYLLQLFL